MKNHILLLPQELMVQAKIIQVHIDQGGIDRVSIILGIVGLACAFIIGYKQIKLGEKQYWLGRYQAEIGEIAVAQAEMALWLSRFSISSTGYLQAQTSEEKVEFKKDAKDADERIVQLRKDIEKKSEVLPEIAKRFDLYK